MDDRHRQQLIGVVIFNLQCVFEVRQKVVGESTIAEFEDLPLGFLDRLGKLLGRERILQRDGPEVRRLLFGLLGVAVPLAGGRVNVVQSNDFLELEVLRPGVFEPLEYPLDRLWDIRWRMT